MHGFECGFRIRAASWIETTSVHPCHGYAASMFSSLDPDPWARAPRAADGHGAPYASLRLAPRDLQGALLCVIHRDTRNAALSDAQRLTHLPATPFVCLTVLQDFDASFIAADAPDARWQPFGARAVVSGSQSQATMTWSPVGGRAVL